ncbi:helix-turn-helix domain-containing protein [[Kitasatospora] papulosa]|uniref:helix-turn-helix domain-containing protein n=1 Tax=[Kitasatospora] papulosa TaxID=1464011 RepID=UPI003693CEA7
MARRENPVPPCSRSLLALVTWLRSGRDTAGLTYGQLAARTEYSADTLARAASGRSVPQNLTVILAYAAACGLSTKDAERLWKHARRATRPALRACSTAIGPACTSASSRTSPTCTLRSSTSTTTTADRPCAPWTPVLAAWGGCRTARSEGSSRAAPRPPGRSWRPSPKRATSAGASFPSGPRPGTGRTPTGAAAGCAHAGARPRSRAGPFTTGSPPGTFSC